MFVEITEIKTNMSVNWSVIFTSSSFSVKITEFKSMFGIKEKKVFTRKKYGIKFLSVKSTVKIGSVNFTDYEDT